MTTIPFDVNDPALRGRFFREHLGEALAALAEGSRPRWGGMTAQQMVEHLEWNFEVSTGRASVECTVPEARRERFKSFLRDNTPMLHEFRNPALAAGLPRLRHPGLSEARAALAVELSRFLEHERSAPRAVYTHPVFGPITVEEWARAHFKHAYHHLLQFDLIEEPMKDLAAERAELFRVDRAWAQAAAARDVEKSVSFWADDARVFPPGQPAVVGREAIRGYVSAALTLPGFSIQWQTTDFVVSASGDLAYGFGTNTVTLDGPDGTRLTEHGRAVTVWRKDSGGSWKCVVDIWNVEAPAPAR